MINQDPTDKLSVALDFRQAKAKHLLFKSGLRSLLYGAEVDEAPVVSHYECTVGKWIYNHALDAYGHIPQMIELEKVHAAIHTVARELIALYKQGAVDEARRGLTQVEETADRLVALLDTVEQHILAENRDAAYALPNLAESLTEMQDLQRSNLELDKRFKEQSAELFKIKERFELVAKATQDAIWDWDLRANTVWWNDGFKTMFGYTGEEIEPGPESWYNRIHSADKQRVIDHINDVINTGGKQWADEYRFRRADGTYAYIFDRGYALHDAAGNVYRMVGSMQDITAAKETGRKLKESEERFRNMADSAPVKIWITDADGNCTYLNKRWLHFTGQTLEEGLGLGWLQAVHPDDFKRSGEIFLAANKAQVPFSLDYRLRRNDGRYRWAVDSGMPRFDADGKFLGYIGSVLDITERKLAEEKQAESEERLRQALLASAMGSWKVDLATRQDTRDAGLNRILGLEPAEAVYPLDDFIQQMHPDDRSRIAASIAKTIQGCGDFNEEFRIVRPGGEVRWLRDRGKVICDAQNGPAYMTGIAMDITEQKTAEESLQLQARVLESMDEGVSVSDENGYILYTNDAEDKMFGYEPGGLIGQHVSAQNAYPPEENSRIVTSVMEELKTKGSWSGEWHNKKKDGTPFYTYSHISALNTGGKKMLVCVQRDITEEKKTKEALQKSAETLEQNVQERTRQLEVANEHLKRSNAELEQFAYVASHDLQEPLRKITMFSNLLLDRYPLQAEVKNYVEKMSSASRRMAGLIRELLDYSRLTQTNPRFEPVDLNETVRHVLADFELTIAQKEAVVHTDALPVVEAVPLQMNQLFFNLIGNALKFSKSGVPARIRIRAEQLPEEKKKNFPQLQADSPYCVVTVEDNGIGFNQEYADKMFTIFQQLNEQSRFGGYGIGLALCRKIAENHKGVIYAEGAVQRGAVFTVILPERQP